ncbi:MAG: glycosyltransferase family 39 protein [Candidatus Bathyarchaeota archaeon]|nr:glycosyltransferase family 39 protein [Candidatus Bathyarchaeota archaeon]
MLLDKRDVLTIVLISVVFFSIATYNLGYAQAPATTTPLSVGQSFYVDLGSSADIQSVYLLLKGSALNVTVYAGSPDDWRVITQNNAHPYNSESNQFSEEYYKWYEIPATQTTQYLKFTFGPTGGYSTAITEIAVTGQDGQQIPIVAITDLDSGNPNLPNLVDEQDKVHLPATYMAQTYFDEIYFVRTAEQYLNHQWPYEWTHPPLGKLIQATGLAVFGFSPFGWRIMGVIFATLMIPVIYTLGKKLFGTRIGAFAAAFLLTFDFMHFTMGRMGTADTYVVFFSLLSQTFFFIYFMNVIKKGWKTSVLPLFFAVVFFGLGFSTKWIVMWGAVGMFFLLLALRAVDISRLKAGLAAKFGAFFNRPILLLFGFIGIAVLIYFATYIPDMMIGRPLYAGNGVGIIDLQSAMYNYHSTLVAEHGIAYDSPWWSWPFILTPLWLASSPALPNNFISTIMLMGNPAVWWIGFACVIVLALTLGKDALIIVKNKFAQKPPSPEQTTTAPTEEPTENLPPEPAAAPVHKLDVAAVFIVVLFFVQWLSYASISRLTYIYHFYISVPFLCLASAYFINKIWNHKYGKIVTVAYFVAVVAFFVLLYAPISGMPATTEWLNSLKLLGRYWIRP